MNSQREQKEQQGDTMFALVDKLTDKVQKNEQEIAQLKAEIAELSQRVEILLSRLADKP